MQFFLALVPVPLVHLSAVEVETPGQVRDECRAPMTVPVIRVFQHSDLLISEPVPTGLLARSRAAGAALRLVRNLCRY